MISKWCMGLIPLAVIAACVPESTRYVPDDGGSGTGGSAGTSGTGGAAGSSSGRAGSGGATGGGAAVAGGGGDGGDGAGSAECGDGVVEDTERCDDGNLQAGDGCSGDCRVESGWSCDGSNPTVCDEICGDGIVVGAEAAAGGCDDENAVDGDGCSGNCTVESGYFCWQTPSVCSDTCGNGVLDGNEECDDQNGAPGDGCYACVEELDWNCTNAPSSCTQVNDCAGDPCGNGGVCTDGVGMFTCDCAGTGFSGPTCETSTDDCNPDPCEHGGVCIDGSSDYVCQCDGTGYEGPTCEENVDDCSPDPCLHGGACSDRLNDYECDCTGTGYYGTTCELDVVDCSPNPCQHGGDCMEGAGTITCDCTGTGYEGSSCQSNVDDCSPNPCENGGDCTDELNGFSCDCAMTGFAGTTCQTNINDCASNPCQNGGTCTDGVNDYSCSCPSGFTGDDCETNVDDCAGNPCQHGGSCVDGVNAYTCDCAGTGFVGTSCETDAGWTRQLGTSGSDNGYGASADSSGNAYVAGWTTGTFSGQSSEGNTDAFVAKYSSSGTLEWTRQFGTNAGDAGHAVSNDSDGNAYVAGYSLGTFSGQSNAGAQDVFIAKYDTAGTAQWTRQLGSSSNDSGTAIGLDSSGNVTVAGYTEGTFAGQSSTGGQDVFIAKYDGTGTLQWTRQFGTDGDDSGWGVGVDSSGAAYVAGLTGGVFSGQSNAGDFDAFVAKYDSAGTLQWTRQFGTSNTDYARGVGVDSNGNAYVTGYTLGTFSGQSSAGGSDVFIVKYNSAGTLQWTRQFGAVGIDWGYGVSVDSNGNAYVGGVTYGTLPGQASAGQDDAFVAKYSASGAQQWARQFGTGSSDQGRGVGVDPTGNAYVVGITSSVFPGQTSAGGQDVFVRKAAP